MLRLFMHSSFSGFMSRTRLLTAVGVTFLTTLVASVPLEAQVLYGSIVGNVKDQSGAAIPGAEVAITQQETNWTRQGVTNDVGAHSFSTVPAGTYTVRVTMPGFKEYVKTNVPVSQNNVTRVDVTLEVGEVAETLTVTSEATLLQSDRAEVRAELPEDQLANLPVPLGRNYQNLFKTIPGFTPPEEAHSIQTNPSRSLAFNVNGVSRSINNTRIDGATTVNPWLPHINGYVPALESIQNVNVVTNSFDAEQGLAGGAAIAVQLKGGTNEYHGSAFFTHHDNALRARNYFFPADQRKGKFIFNQFGGTVGGPIKKDKLFYFASFERTTDGRTGNAIGTVPTEAMRNGDFSAFDTIIYDPLTGNADASGRQRFANNQIPRQRLHPISQKILDSMPMPNLGRRPDGSFPISNNFVGVGPSFFNRSTFDVKVDWNASARLTLFGRFSFLDYDNVQESIFGNDGLVGPALTGFGGGGGNIGTGRGNTYVYGQGATYVISPNLLVDGNFGFNRFITDSRNPRLTENIGSDFLGLPGTNGPREFQGGWPLFNIPGFTAIGSTELFMPYERRDDTITWVANMTWTRGSHEFRWGLDFIKMNMNHIQPEFAGGFGGARGRFQFVTGVTRLCTQPDGKGGCKKFSDSTDQINGMAGFLLGLPQRVGKNLLLVAPFTTRNWGYSLYFRDRWQLASKFTFSYGLRWEYHPIPTRKDRGLERFDADINRMLIGGVGDVDRDLGVGVDKDLFAPRLGIAYRATDTLVIRAGYGLTIDPFPLARPLRTNFPVLVEQIFESPNSWTPVSSFEKGIPPLVETGVENGIIDVPGTATTFGIQAPFFNRGYVQSWNLTLQKQLKWGFVGEAGYVASRSIRQMGFRELNYADIGTGSKGRQLFKKFGRTGNTQLATPLGGTHYDSLQARLQRRFADGYSLDVAYTWGKSITNTGEDDSDGSLDINIPEFFHLNRRLSGIDRRHNLQISHVWQLPFGRGKRWLSDVPTALNWIVSGWQVNGILSFVSGTPFTITSSGSSLNAPGNSQQADRIKEANVVGGIGPDAPYFDVTAFRPVNEPRFGTAGFNVLTGPATRNWDFGLFRVFDVNEDVNIQFRFEAFNFTNTPQFNNPSGRNVSNARFDAAGNITDRRGFGSITSARGERVIRFGVRIGF